jgi:hypothetical protein
VVVFVQPLKVPVTPGNGGASLRFIASIKLLYQLIKQEETNLPCIVILSVSEGSHTLGNEILRFAQNDKRMLGMTRRSSE